MKMVNGNPTSILKPGEIHIWLFDLDDPNQDSSVWEGLLSVEEASCSKRYRFNQDRLRFVVRRGILRQLLADYTSLEPSAITYHTNPYGKLSLPSHPLKFNLSSCQNRVIFTFMLENELGVDLEQVRPLTELNQMVKHWFSPAEQASLFALAPDLHKEAFFHIWTQKEAFLKAHGEGLSLPLQDFSVSVNPKRPGGVLSIRNGTEEVSDWKMYTYELATGWRAAVCAETELNMDVLWHKPELVDFETKVTSMKMSISV
jgi:4'-phosphopantetheinyl transferase